MQELEFTYLAKYLPKNLKKFPHREILDLYIPKSRLHPSIRIRKKDNVYELSCKRPVNLKDLSIQEETNIHLDKDEYQALMKIRGKKIHKIRYYYPYEKIAFYHDRGKKLFSKTLSNYTIVENDKVAEIDIFLGKLKGLVAVEFEFKNVKEMRRFKMPDFCLADVTNEKHSAGGHLAGRSYKDLKPLLEKYNYKPLSI